MKQHSDKKPLEGSDKKPLDNNTTGFRTCASLASYRIYSQKMKLCDYAERVNAIENSE